MAETNSSLGPSSVSFGSGAASSVPPSNPLRKRDDDEISLTSTVESEAQEEYEVETVYAQDIRYGAKMYLVKWKGYSDLRCTWEPASSFNDSDTLKAWKRKRLAIQQGIRAPFDVEAWEARLEASEDARDERKRRRREKRARVSLLEISKEGSSIEREAEHGRNSRKSAGESPTDGGDNGIPVRQRRLPSAKISKKDQMDQSHGEQTQPQPPEGQKHAAKTAPASQTAPRRAERPTLAIPEPVGMAVLEGRNPNKGLVDVLQRAKEKQNHSAEENKTWKLFSTTNKFDKAAKMDHEPDRGQLELRKPGDWTPFQMSSYLRGQRNNANDSLFVEQEDDDDDDDDPVISATIASAATSSMANPVVGASPSSLVRVVSGLRSSNSPIMKTTTIRKPGPRSMKSSGRVYKIGARELSRKGDLLCQLFYGHDDVGVGDVSVCNLSESARRTIYKRKEARDINIHFDELCSLEQYRALTDKLGSDIHFNGCITAFADTQAKLTVLSKLLLDKDLVGISRIPNGAHPVYSVTLFCYPTGSKSFQFLNRYSYTAPDGSLGIAGMAGLLPRPSRTRPAQDIPDEGVGRLARPERQGRFHESMEPRLEGFLSRRLSSQTIPSPPRLDMKSLSTQPTPSPLKVRKITKTPGPSRSTNTISGIAVKSTPKPSKDSGLSAPSDRGSDSSKGPPIIIREKTPTDHSNIKENTATTHSVSDKNAISSSVRLVVRDAVSDIGPLERSATEPNRSPNDKQATEHTSSLTTFSLQEKPSNASFTDPAAMEITDDTPPNPDPSKATSEKKDLENRQDVEMLDADNKENIDSTEYIKKVFPRVFKLDFHNLAAVNTSWRANFTNCFYLYFPEEADGDYQVLEHFLESHFAIVLSNRKPNDWEKFAKSQSGVALFHHSFIGYYTLPGFYNLTRSTSFNFWNASLDGFIPNLDPEVHFQRIFPNGAGFLMTEDVMRHDPDAAIIILAWFRDYAYSKLPGSYRMMFRPNILEWLEMMSDKDPRFEVMAVLIGYIYCRGEPSNWPMEARDLDQLADPCLETSVVSIQDMPKVKAQDDKESPAPSDATARANRATDYLCEIFSTWSLLNAASMRRFCIITLDEPREPWRSWTHIEVCRGINDFYQRWNVKKENYTKWLAQNDASKPLPEKPHTVVWDPQAHKLGTLPKPTEFRRSSDGKNSSK
ncbi:hypothetical protein BGW36DRAFT_426055 [Talaromyces proteolyticus]|uniref:Chromo domain-containing protein n=1 Tax=Talaromyces proteolyticus TaxID=1131652 RepID=A0AAD4KWA9_9EURO|nr:uncharacterized protein BGW36DRAFT_426055 [Talaromyces proteolyticus]KAH8698343.1 hypothetical protein BGW36DRAFT_426055 [Talaromyces proteolyticus]